jgi:hypothetical protein
MALTLMEAAKLHSGDVYRASIIELFARSSDLLRALPFITIGGNAYSYNQEGTLPGVAFRGVNEAFPESTGVINPKTESLKIAGGDLDVDRFIVQTMGPDQRTVHENMKIKALSQRITKTFIKGDESTQPREFDGLQTRLTGAQVINAGIMVDGSALSLMALDEAIDAVESPTHLIMNKTMRRLLTTAARDTAVGGFITYDLDEFGRRAARYNDLPILIVDKDDQNMDILPFTEANPGGGTAASTSIYVVSMGEDKLAGLQNGDIDPRDLGELDALPVFRTRVEWYISICVLQSMAAARLRGIKNAPVVK